MRNATLRLHRCTEVVEFRIIAFEQGGVSAWRVQHGRALGRNIDFQDSDAGSADAIRNAACVLALWHPEAAYELVIEP
jgi:hypothetical protein